MVALGTVVVLGAMTGDARAAETAAGGPALRQARAEPEYLYRFRRPELYGPLAAIG